MDNPPLIPKLLVLLIALGVFVQRTSGFTFNTSTPTQCGPLTLQWDGGQEPFQFLLVPTVEIGSGRILNFTLPTGLSQPYSYTFDLSAPVGLEFLATMHDATGFGTGGTTPVLTVGSSDNTSCLEQNLLYDFTFQLSPDSNPAQCSSQTITWPNNVTRPVNLFGMIPGGTAWRIPIPQDQTSYDWQVDIDSGTEYLFVMSDAGPYATGGSSPLIRVASGSSGCMNSTSPRAGGSSGSGSATTSSTGPSASVSGVGGSSSGGDAQGNDPQKNTSSGSSSNTGAIVGGTVGGVAFLVLLALLLFCCVRRRVRPRRESADPMIRSYGVDGEPVVEKRRHGAMDLFAAQNRPARQFSDDSQTEAREGGAEYQPSPFTYPDSSQAAAMGGAATPPVVAASGRQPYPTAENEKGATRTAIAPAFLDDNRNSMESHQTSNTGTGTGTTPNLATASDVGGTEAATVGHAGGVQRHSSIAKPALGTSTPESGTIPLTQAPQPGEPRFVQHEDSGEVVDLPPRYDQLRARNPDPE